MLQLQSQSKFVTKILTAENGDIYRVIFLVSLVNGEIKAQVVNAELISASSNSDDALKLCLPCSGTDKIVEILSNEVSYTSVLSDLNKLNFFFSQPTRAPSLI